MANSLTRLRDWLDAAGKMGRMCVCGHKEGMHWLRPTGAGDQTVGECSECACEVFVEKPVLPTP